MFIFDEAGPLVPDEAIPELITQLHRSGNAESLHRWKSGVIRLLSHKGSAASAAIPEFMKLIADRSKAESGGDSMLLGDCKQIENTTLAFKGLAETTIRFWPPKLMKRR